MSDWMAAEDEVVATNDRFYRAFESLDIKEMEAVWLTDGEVQCIHPGWGPLRGWAEVRDGWVRIFNNTSSMRFTPRVLHVATHADVAWLVCVEAIHSRHGEEEQTSHVLATNVFERREGRWGMVHHHASPVFRASQGEQEEPA
ncbi:MAG: nuclear transport factor 2 family protein [Nitrospiria bacterium]